MIWFVLARPNRMRNSLTQVHKNHGRRKKSAEGHAHLRIFEKEQKNT